MSELKSSIVEYRGKRERGSCGYCRGSSKYTHGMWAHRLTVEDYQDLIDRGWRRSGKYTYKPTMNKTCCPQYTIKCGVLDFKLNKSHKKLLKKVHKYFNTGIQSGAGEDDGKQDKAAVSGLDSKTAAEKPKEKEQPAPGKGPDPSKPPSKKAKLLRLEKKKQKLSKLEQEGHADLTKAVEGQSSNGPKSPEQWLKDLTAESPKHKLEVRLIATPHPSRSAEETAEFDRTFEESFQVFRKYQMQIHKEGAHENTKSTYKSFLVESPLLPEKPSNGPRCGYGSFHQQYWLDGKLIAVGVIDILPYCISSVYLYYDPDYEYLNIGTYSALREIAFTRSLQQEAPDLKYYYMGFYIHTCPKMKYKGQYVPSLLLCPEAYTWVPIETCTPKLDSKRYSRFEETGKVDENGVVNLDEVLVLFERQAMPYSVYKALNSRANDESVVKEYAGFVGKKCYQRMLLFRS